MNGKLSLVTVSHPRGSLQPVPLFKTDILGLDKPFCIGYNYGVSQVVRRFAPATPTFSSYLERWFLMSAPIRNFAPGGKMGGNVSAGLPRHRYTEIGGGWRSKPAATIHLSDMMTEDGTIKTSKMKVHPGMLMKTNKGRFQVSGVRKNSPGVTSVARDVWRREKLENEGSSGDVDEKKEKQVSGARCRVSVRIRQVFQAWSAMFGPGKNSKMKVHPGMLMKRKKSRFQVSGVRKNSPGVPGV